MPRLDPARLMTMTTLCAVMLLGAAPLSYGAPPTTKPAEHAANANAAGITVAILDFEAKDPGQPDLGKQISDTLTAILSGEPGFTLVERGTLTRVLQEHELNLTGVVDTNQAVKVGKLAGAKIMVTGKSFVLGQKLFITAKVIGTETSLVEGVLVKGEGDAKIDELVLQLATELSKKLRESGPKLVARDDAIDPLPALKEKLATKQLPVVAVYVLEEHHSQTARRPIDPAIETEIKLLLKDCGFTVKDIPQNDLTDWANGDKERLDAWPRSLNGVDLVITGKGFSEYSARIGNLVSCAARAEINVINHTDGKITFVDRITTRDVDLAENIAGKKALEKAGRAIGIHLLENLAKSLPDAKK